MHQPANSTISGDLNAMEERFEELEILLQSESKTEAEIEERLSERVMIFPEHGYPHTQCLSFHSGVNRDHVMYAIHLLQSADGA